MVQWFRVVQNGSVGPWFSGSVVQRSYREPEPLNQTTEPAGDLDRDAGSRARRGVARSRAWPPQLA